MGDDLRCCNRQAFDKARILINSKIHGVCRAIHHWIAEVYNYLYVKNVKISLLLYNVWTLIVPPVYYAYSPRN